MMVSMMIQDDGQNEYLCQHLQPVHACDMGASTIARNVQSRSTVYGECHLPVLAEGFSW